MSGRDPGQAHLRSLTSLRFFAALTVVVAHFDEMGLLDIPKAFNDATDGGGNAVTFFFVLSGFILTYNYAAMRTREQYVRYGVARFARLWPVTVLALLIAAAGALLAVAVGRFEVWSTTDRPEVSLPAAFLGHLLMVSAWFPIPAVQVPFNPPAWSIACEVFFYLLLPLLLVRLRGRGARLLFGVAAVTLVVQGAVLYALSTLAPAGQIVDFAIYRWPPIHLAEFVVGVCAGLLFMQFPQWVTGGRRVLVIAVGTAVLVLLLGFAPPGPDFYPLTPVYAVLIAALAVGGERTGGPLGSNLLVFLGQASFALYLLHWPIAQIADVLQMSTPWGWLLMVGTVALSVAVYRVLETPMRRRIQRTWTAAGQRRARS